MLTKEQIAQRISKEVKDRYYVNLGIAAATERGVYAFGANRDQNSVSPSVLASAVIDLPRAFVEAARRVKEGRFDGTPIRYGLASGVVSFVWNPALLGRVPAPVVDEEAGALLKGREYYDWIFQNEPKWTSYLAI